MAPIYYILSLGAQQKKDYKKEVKVPIIFVEFMILLYSLIYKQKLTQTLKKKKKEEQKSVLMKSKVFILMMK